MAYRIHLIETHESFDVAADESLLEGALRANVALRHDCRLGGCGACRVKLVEGAVRYDESPLALTPEDERDGYALACQARPAGDLVISTARADEACAEPRPHTARVHEIHPLSKDVLHVKLDVAPSEGLTYRPGQYLKIFTDAGTTRSFSMASVPNDTTLELHVRQIPGGAFTEGTLSRLRPGDTLDLELPHGTFFYREQDERPLLMIATGTGLAPIKSMLESLMDHADCPPVALYWGMRQPDDLYLHDDILQWGERLYDFHYTPVLSRAGDAWTGRRGYVHHAVLDDLQDLSEYAIYLCGSPNMIRDARKAFIERGANPAYLYADSFTFQSGQEATAKRA